MDNFNIGSVAVSLSLFTLYHAVIYSSVYMKSKSIKLYKNLINSRDWIKKHKAKEDAPNVTLAIQTLRNTIFVAVFLGGSAFTAAYNTLNNLNKTRDINGQCRGIILSILLICSFLAFASVIRAASHLGYQIGTMYNQTLHTIPSPDNIAYKELDDIENKKKKIGDDTSELDIVKESNRMISVMIVSFNLGFRFLYVSIAFIFYSAGPIALLIATGFMLVYLYLIDHFF